MVHSVVLILHLEEERFRHYKQAPWKLEPPMVRRTSMISGQRYTLANHRIWTPIGTYGSGLRYSLGVLFLLDPVAVEVPCSSELLASDSCGRVV